MHGFLIIRIVFLNFGMNCELTYFFSGLYATTALIPKFLMYLSLSFFVSRRWVLFHACSCSIAVGDEIIIIIRVLKDQVSNYMVITDFNPIWRDFYNLTYFTMHWHIFSGEGIANRFPGRHGAYAWTICQSYRRVVPGKCDGGRFASWRGSRWSERQISEVVLGASCWGRGEQDGLLSGTEIQSKLTSF